MPIEPDSNQLSSQETLLQLLQKHKIIKCMFHQQGNAPERAGLINSFAFK